jgi:hypothetical protein
MGLSPQEYRRRALGDYVRGPPVAHAQRISPSVKQADLFVVRDFHTHEECAGLIARSTPTAYPRAC